MKLRHFNHERLIIVAIWVGLIWTLSTLGWELPVQSVVNPTCDKSAQWGDLDDSCKLDIYKNGSVPTETESVGDLLFSVLRWASYTNNRTPQAGWHPSLDIVSVQWTPVFSIWAWKVTNASLRNGYGNAVTVQHTLDDWTVVYSNYSHLDKIFVKTWEQVEEWQHIWDVWRTWFTMGKYGNHLDFQITTSDSPSHPYGYHDCEVSYYDAVEQWACGDKLKKYTIDPVQFFLDHWNYDLTPLTWVPIKKSQSIQEHTVAKVVEAIEESIEEVTTPLPDNNINTLLQAIIANRTSLNTTIFSGLQREYNQFTNTLTVTQQVAWEVALEEELKLWAPYSWSMKEKISIEYKRDELAIAPWRFSRVVDWSKILGTETLLYSNN